MARPAHSSERRPRRAALSFRVLVPAFGAALTAGCLGALDLDRYDVGADVDAVDVRPGLDVAPMDGGDEVDAGIDIVDEEVAEPVRLPEVHARVFARACAPCHTERVSGGLSLRERPELRDALVAPATQATDVLRVQPGDPERSYLWLKLHDRQDEVGGLGVRMPLGGTLEAADLALLRRWIEDGALP